VKDLLTRNEIARYNSSGPLYPCVSLLPPSPLWPPHPLALASTSRSSWS
jgi:hypothetical protein